MLWRLLARGRIHFPHRTQRALAGTFACFGFFRAEHHAAGKAKFSKHQASTFKVLYVHCLCTARYGFSGKS